MDEIIYFELNNWMPSQDYPDNDRFLEWFGDDLNLRFNNENWIKENKLCVRRTIIDMSLNYCVTATKSWVEANCPELLTDYTKFLRYPDEDGDVYGRWDTLFAEYCDENIGITDVDMDID